MEEQVEVLSESMLSGEEFDPNQFEDDESDSQFSVTSGTSISTDLSGSNNVWIYCILIRTQLTSQVIIFVKSVLKSINYQ